MPVWSVQIEHAVPIPGEAQFDALCEALTGYAGQLGETPAGRLGVNLAVTAPSLDNAIAEGLRAVTGALRQQGMAGELAHVTGRSWAEFEADTEASRMPPITGISGLANMLGVSVQRASQLVRDNPVKLPVIGHLNKTTPFLLLSDVERYAATHRTGTGPARSGRPKGSRNRPKLEADDDPGSR